MGFFTSSLVAYFLMWTTPQGVQIQGFEDRQLTSLCEAKQSHPGSSGYAVHVAKSSSVYAVMCHTPRCAEPPATVTIVPVECKRIPAVESKTVEPEHWEER